MSFDPIAFVLSPSISLLLLSVLAVEAILLMVVWKRSGRGLPPLQIVSFLGAGAAFAVVLGLVLLDESASLIALALLTAFFFHLLDLWLRWQ